MAYDLATRQDVEARWRPLSGQSIVVAQSLLTDASAMVRAAVPNVDARIEADGEFGELVQGVVAAMVIRVLRDQAAPGTGSTALYIGAAELSTLFGLGLGSTQGAFTITPGGPYLPPVDPLTGWV